MRVHGQPLGGVEQLHEQAGRRAEAGHVLVTQPRDRIGFHDVTKEAAVGETRESLLRIVPAGIPRRRHRADPVLGEDVVRFGLPAQPADERSPSIEAVDAARQQTLGAHYSPVSDTVSSA